MEKLTTYEYYKNNYVGSLIPQDKFDSYNIKATSKVNYFTSNRIVVTNNNIPNNIQNCVCEIAELLYTQDINKESLNADINGNKIQSETVGPHSVTYANTISSREKQIYSTDDLDKEIYQICSTYLVHTGLMYRGV